MFKNPWTTNISHSNVIIEVTNKLEEVSNQDTGVKGFVYKAKIIMANEIISLSLTVQNI